MHIIEEKSKLGTTHNYLVITELPSKNRSYVNFKHALVRDLFFDEVRSLAAYLKSDEINTRQLVNSYRDVIKLVDQDDNIIAIENLELLDFHYLLVVSSLLTDESQSWILTTKCDCCDEKIEYKVSYDQIDYEFKDSSALELGYVDLIDAKVKPLTVLDKILLEDENYVKYLPEYAKSLDPSIVLDIMSYAISLIRESDSDLTSNFNKINSNMSLRNKVKEVNNLLSARIKPFEVKCKCGCSKKVSYEFDKIRSYL